jgi:cysteine synthase A
MPSTSGMRTSISTTSGASRPTCSTASGRAIEHVFETLVHERPQLQLAAFVSASGSAGTLGAGDYLKERHGAKIVAAEALECPTLLLNGFGEHNIQGIGD